MLLCTFFHECTPLCSWLQNSGAASVSFLAIMMTWLCQPSTLGMLSLLFLHAELGSCSHLRLRCSAHGRPHGTAWPLG